MPLSKEALLEKLYRFLKSSRNIAILTGAGISTKSGIPDYRGPKGVYSTNPEYKPITFQQFMGVNINMVPNFNGDMYRRRYWARSFYGWKKFQLAKPNMGHLLVQELLNYMHSKSEMKSFLITQNVDGLHHKAQEIVGGSNKILELHGGLQRVVCTRCGVVECRDEFQVLLEQLNPDFLEKGASQVADVASSTSTRPDGDSEVAEYANFKYPPCKSCSTTEGILKPDVVFFGENLAQNISEQVFESISVTDGLLVIASSLTVYSAFRLVKLALSKGKPVFIVNLGKTRADEMASMNAEIVKMEADCTIVLANIVERLKNGHH